MRASHNDNIHSGLTLIETRKRYQLATKREYAELIKMYAVSPFATHLSQAALETLAIIAYKQPLTRMEIDQNPRCAVGRLGPKAVAERADKGNRAFRNTEEDRSYTAQPIIS